MPAVLLVNVTGGANLRAGAHTGSISRFSDGDRGAENCSRGGSKSAAVVVCSEAGGVVIGPATVAGGIAHHVRGGSRVTRQLVWGVNEALVRRRPGHGPAGTRVASVNCPANSGGGRQRIIHLQAGCGAACAICQRYGEADLKSRTYDSRIGSLSRC